MALNNLEKVHDFLLDIAAGDGLNEKKRLLALFIQDPVGKAIVSWAYDPFIRFGITPPQKTEKNGSAPGDLAWIEPLLHGLASRDITGNDAVSRVEGAMSSLSEKAAEVLRRILAKDLRCGIATSSINEVEPGLIPVFAIMRAHAFEEKRMTAWPVAVEPKMDGFRGVWKVDEGVAAVYTRSGQVMHPAQPLADELSTALGKAGFEPHLIALDGEVMAGDFNKTSGDLRRKSKTADDAVFHVFDAFDPNVFKGASPAPYAERRALVEKIIANLHRVGFMRVQLTPRYFANSIEEVMGYYERFRARGLEGAMVKKLDGTYKRGKSYDWLKIKAEETEDLVITGAFPGEPGTKYENCLGGVIVDRQGVEVRVGGGFSDDLRVSLWADWLHDQALREQDVSHLKAEARLLGRMIEVEYHEVTKDGSLRHPRFKRFRDDKNGEIEVAEAA